MHVIFVFAISIIFVVVVFSLCLAFVVMLMCFEPVLTNFCLLVFSLCIFVV